MLFLQGCYELRVLDTVAKLVSFRPFKQSAAQPQRPVDVDVVRLKLNKAQKRLDKLKAEQIAAIEARP